jgi:7-cyano-7-deazaguanine synthase
VSRAAVVLLSGGLDSATVAGFALWEGYKLHALTFDYGQRHRVEIEAARGIAEVLGVESHTVFKIDLRQFGGSALTADIAVPHDRSQQDIAHGIPITYVPARNLVFLSIGVALAEVQRCTDLFIGVNAVDYSGYPDCRPEFIDAFAKTATLATRIGVEGACPITVHTPLAGMSKAQIVALGMELGVPLDMTTSCYDPAPDGTPCGTCDSCQIRQRGFQQAGVPDPARSI